MSTIEEQGNGADMAVDAFGVKANVRNVKSLNTMATVVTMIATLVVAYVLITHNAEARDGGKEIAAALIKSNEAVAAALKESNKDVSNALKDLAQQSREQNCLIATGVQNLPADRRQEAANLCKRLSR